MQTSRSLVIYSSSSGEGEGEGEGRSFKRNRVHTETVFGR